ncbi:MAG TPA: hypothetical protein DDY52_02855, partial [Candidatus Moranbacteria bacterium]|nr:hypothetical protein [Candidatus Moranbacteria bacterium]
FVVLPGYLIGRYFGAAQVGTYGLISVFAFLNFLLIIAISSRLGAGRWASFLGALTFVFATPAFAYGVNLYQHHISVFLLLVSLYLIIRYNNYISLSIIWFLCTLSVIIDNPNFFLMLPVGVFAFYKMIILLRADLSRGNFFYSLLKSLITFVAIVPPIIFFLWYNNAAYGDSLQLPGTLPSVSAIDENNKPIDKSKIDNVRVDDDNVSKEKTALGFFKTRNLYNGLYEHFVSADRGIIYFTPVILFGILGLIFLYRDKPVVSSLFIAVIGFNVLLYSMWGDPYGGWAFGSRYLIPTYAILSIGISLGLHAYSRKWIFPIIFILLFTYSAWVNTLGAITTSTIPTKAEVLLLEQRTGHEEKYNFMRSWEFLNKKYSDVGSKSFLYQVSFKKHLDSREYFYVVYGAVLLIAFAGGIFFYKENVIKNK